jgi:hypothetical protein
MATKKKTKAAASASKKKGPTKVAKKIPEARKAVKPLKKPKPGAKGIKCCVHCPDFERCDEKGVCCDYCDFYLNARCTFGKKKGIPSVDQEVELPDYRGDDYGIDDYEAYEPVYE